MSSGMPVPQGSKRVFGGHLVDVNDRKLKDWRGVVGRSVQRQELLDGAALRQARLLPPAPEGALRDGEKRGQAQPSAPAFPETKPDIDKLVRACLDAMTGMVFRDDSQVAALAVAKRYADGRQPGVSIKVEQM